MVIRKHLPAWGALVWLVSGNMVLAADPPSDGLAVDDPASCAPCHGAVVSEWQESMHARSHAQADPLFAALRELRVKKEGEAVGEGCNQCHTPRSVDAPDAPAGRVGVGCASCHLAASLSSDASLRGAARLVWADDGILRGPHSLEAGASPVHGTGPAADHLTDGQSICLACHDQMANPAGVPTCTTGAEVGASSPSCASCHMPLVAGPSGTAAADRTQHRSHAFPGPHRAWLQNDRSILSSAVEMRLSVEGSELVVELQNRSAHAFPSGFPGRVGILKAVGRDASGAVVWTNWSTNPMKESPASVLGKVYVDGAGNPVLPPYAERLARDSRLVGDEVRSLRFPIPAGAVSVEATLLYFLIPAPAAAVLGVSDLPEAAPVVVHQATVTRP